MSDLSVTNMPETAKARPRGEFDPEIGASTDRLAVGNVLAEMEKALNDIVSDNPRLAGDDDAATVRLDDLKAVLEISLAVNSSLVVDEIL